MSSRSECFGRYSRPKIAAYCTPLRDDIRIAFARTILVKRDLYIQCTRGTTRRRVFNRQTSTAKILQELFVSVKETRKREEEGSAMFTPTLAPHLTNYVRAISPKKYSLPRAPHSHTCVTTTRAIASRLATSCIGDVLRRMQASAQPPNRARSVP